MGPDAPAPRRLAVVTAALALLGLSGCTDVVERRVFHRSACEVCHAPLTDGVPHGIETAHPWHYVSCTTCHGGQDRVCDGTLGGTPEAPTCDGAWVYDEARSHVSPGGGPAYLKNLSPAALDRVPPDYLRFINPGDQRVARKTCGLCHQAEVKAQEMALMRHTAGELAVARWRGGKQPSPLPLFAAVDVSDADADPDDACTVATLSRFDPPPIAVASTDPYDAPTVANAVDQLLAKSCVGCHLASFGDNRSPGSFRSSGCTSCHMPYNLDGRYLGADPRVDRESPPHPARHELVRAPPNFACTACHHDGARIGPSFEGYRERGGGPGPAHPGIMGVALYGNDANFYITDEDTTNDWDETPPDVHFAAGLRCADCHEGVDVHGDGHLAANLQCASKATCEGCHGTARAPVTLSPSRPRLFARDGRVILRTVAAGVELEVPQVIDAVTPGNPRYSELAATAMGVSAGGTSHTDTVACATCHSAFLPSCYGCHATVDLTEADLYQLTGASVPGRVSARRGAVALYDLVLMRGEDGRYAPSMPAERLFVTLLEPDGAGGRRARFSERPRTFETDDGRVIAGFGQRAISPHTTQRRSQFAACDRCHAVGAPEAPDNAALLDLTYGFGTRRFDVVACPPGDAPCDDPATDGVTYHLDAVIDREGRPLVAVGHGASRPLTLAEIARMQAVVVPAETPIPEDARSNPAWPGPREPGAGTAGAAPRP